MRAALFVIAHDRYDPGVTSDGGTAKCSLVACRDNHDHAPSSCVVQCLRQCTFIFDGRPGQCGTDVYDTDSRVRAVRQGLREFFRLGTRIVDTGRRFEEDRTDEQNAVGADRRSFRSAGPDEDPCCIGAVPCAQATLLTWLHGTARLGPMS